MKIIITGSLGNISKPLAKELLQKGHAVTVISSNPEKQKDIEALGATAAIGSIEDVEFLAAAFTGADAVYCMVPPPTHGFPAGVDAMANWGMFVNNYAKAITQSGVKRVVYLSSIGAHLSEGTGLILGHYKAEQIMNALPDVAITFMRPTAFYYNLLSFVPAIKNTGMMSSNYGETDNVAWVSPLDIAAAIAEELVTPPETSSGRKIRYVASEELSCNEVAAILGEAIGNPGLKWALVSSEQMRSRLEGVGMPAKVAAGLVEMQDCMHNGPFFDDYYLNRPVMGKVKLAEYAKEFAAVFNK